MANNKTAQTKVNVHDFIESFVTNAQKKADTYQLIALMQKWTGFEPKMWGPSIIGFGTYHYKYASGHEGDAPLLAFSPRKAAFSLYVFSPKAGNEKLLDGLGKFKLGKACIYVKRLADIDISVLEKLAMHTVKQATQYKADIPDR